MNIPEIKLALAPETEEAREIVGFKYAGREIGRRNKIGGQPEFIQAGYNWPMCCGSKMTFYAQLDSVGDEVCIADCGMVYVFVCFGCFNSSSFIQSY